MCLYIKLHEKHRNMYTSVRQNQQEWRLTAQGKFSHASLKPSTVTSTPSYSKGLTLTVFQLKPASLFKEPAAINQIPSWLAPVYKLAVYSIIYKGCTVL